MTIRHFVLPIVASVTTSLAAAAASPVSGISVGDFMARASKQTHCSFTVEAVVPPGKRFPGFLEVRVPRPPPKLTENGIIGFISKNLKGYVALRDRVKKSVVHIVALRLLKWKANPLNRRVTVHGSMTPA